jgi:hypothetical protein
MKRPTKQLLKDLLDDSVSPEFRGRLMDKTLRSARRRKRRRHFNLALSAVVLAGGFAFVFQEMRESAVSLGKNRPPILNAMPASPLNPVRVVNTKPNSVADVVSPDSASALTIVHTTESAQPKEINDKQLLALLSNKPVALVNRGTHQAELIFLDSQDERRFPVQ